MREPKEIAVLIEQLCARKSISVRSMLESCDLKGSLVDNLKKGSIPSADKLAIVARRLEVPTDYLLGNEQKNKPTTDNNDKFIEEVKQMTKGMSDSERQDALEAIKIALRVKGLLK